MRDALRPLVVLCVVSLLAATAPGSAAAATPSISSSIDGIAGNNGWWRGSTGGNFIVLHWTVTANPPLTNSSGCDPAISISGPTTGVTKTCTATNDDGTSTSSKTMKVDADPPTGVGATPARAPDASGWYNHLVGLTWSGSDATSGIASCTTSSYSSPDSASVSAPGSCQDNAGNFTSAPFSLKYDATDPQDTVSPDRPPNGNGWYTSQLTITWGGTDATSGIGNCTATKIYSTPDDATASATGSCTDNAGNQGALKSFDFKYDGTPPQVSAGAASRGPDANGWYSHAVTITWSGTDATSGIASCSSATYSGPDSGSASATGGTCTDKAGNVATGPAFGLKYDATGPDNAGATPARGPDFNGWYNHTVGLVWAGTDATSGIASCTSSSYSGPDGISASALGNCQDKAGNVTNAPFSMKYDDTAPTNLSVTPSRGPNANAWYTSPFTFTTSGTDATSGIASCTPQTSYAGPDGANSSVTGSCQDVAGNMASKQLSFDYDATPPQLTAASPSRSADSNGWYSHPVTITWTGTDATSGFAGCTLASYSGPDSASASVAGGTCHDGAGNTAAAPAFHLKYDATPPHIAGATLSRPPDFDGWYTHPVTVTWAGTDALSGIASCTSAPFSGNASATAAATGSCRDKAGNVTSASIPLKYDGTAPALSKVGVASRAGSDLVRWTSSSPDDRIVVKRLARGSKDEQVVFEGAGSRFVDTKIQSGLEYRYAIQSTDQAGNVSKTANVTGFPKVLTLQKTPYVPRAAPKPILRWGSMSAASYYHVQLFRGPTRILAAWPNKRQLGLASSWKWAGHRYTLSPGRYRWFVWGGLGKRSFARYRAMGSARFIVPSR